MGRPGEILQEFLEERRWEGGGSDSPMEKLRLLQSPGVSQGLPKKGRGDSLRRSHCGGTASPLRSRRAGTDGSGCFFSLLGNRFFFFFCLFLEMKLRWPRKQALGGPEETDRPRPFPNGHTHQPSTPQGPALLATPLEEEAPPRATFALLGYALLSSGPAPPHWPRPPSRPNCCLRPRLPPWGGSSSQARLLSGPAHHAPPPREAPPTTAPPSPS